MQQRLLIACVWGILIVSGIGSAHAQMPPADVLLFAYSPASNKIAIDVTVPATSDGRSQSIAEIYDAVSGAYLGFIPAQVTGFIYLQFNATGDRLTTVTADNYVDTWDVNTFSQIKPSLPGGAFEGGPIAWNPRSNWLAASLARQVYISSADAPDPISLGDNETTSTISDMGWSPDGNLLAISTYDIHSATQQITIWDVFGVDPMSTGPILRIVGDSIGPLDWKPDGTAIAAPTVDGVVIYDAVTGETIQRIVTDQRLGYVYEIRWSPDGRQIGVGANDVLWIWDAATGAVVAQYTMPQSVRDIAWLPNGQVLHNGREIGLAINDTGIEVFVLPFVQPTPTLTLTPTHTPTSDTTCTVTAANSNGASPDVICLTNSIFTFVSAANNIALPSITTSITIVGNGAVLECVSGAPNFRFFDVTVAGSAHAGRFDAAKRQYNRQ